MTPIATYVFIDLETTGIPREECNKTKITELSMIAVKRKHVLDTLPGETPRVQNKLTLCFNPRRLVYPSCTDVTKLDNELLEFESPFNKAVFEVIRGFLGLLTKPVCFIAHNGFCFDYPILRNHFEKLDMHLSEDIMCADCYHGFYDILEAKKNKENPVCENIGESVSEDLRATDLNNENEKEVSVESMQLLNETTPKKSTASITVHQPLKAKDVERKTRREVRRRLPFSFYYGKTRDSYKLGNLYKRLLNSPGPEAHRAENDCLMALKCSVALRKEFVEWVDDNHCPFSEVKPMTSGVPLGS